MQGCDRGMKTNSFFSLLISSLLPSLDLFGLHALEFAFVHEARLLVKGKTAKLCSQNLRLINNLLLHLNPQHFTVKHTLYYTHTHTHTHTHDRFGYDSARWVSSTTTTALIIRLFTGVSIRSQCPGDHCVNAFISGLEILPKNWQRQDTLNHRNNLMKY